MDLTGLGRKTTPTTDSPFAMFGVSVTNIVSVVNGTNTATNSDLSLEAKNALEIDTDDDGLPDVVERYYGSDINALDSDEDGFNDGEEVEGGYDPAGPGKLQYNEVWRAAPNVVWDIKNEEIIPSVPTQPIAPTRVAVAPVTDNDHVRGTANAKVTLIEYCDLDGPFCQRFHPVMKQVMDEYGNDVAWAFRHFPLHSIHPNAVIKAKASECAAELGGNEGFWNFIDALYESETVVTADELTSIAGDIGLSESDFQECVDSEKYNAKIQTQLKSGQQAGVMGTPGTFIISDSGDQEYIPGALPYTSVKQLIDSLL